MGRQITYRGNTMVQHQPVITIDVEDWIQSVLDREYPITEAGLRNMEGMLERLERLKLKATTFVLGKFAEAHPAMIRRLHEFGCEIASHGYGHVETFRQTPSEFRADVQRAKHLLEDITGAEVKGYRAPVFSIVRDSLWALRILAETGHRYDVSIFPIHHPRYGIPEWPTEPRCVLVDQEGRSILVFPNTTFPLFGRNWPIGGGGYFRLFPYGVSRFMMRERLKNSGYIFYCHPYEFNSHELDEVPVPMSLKVRLHQGLWRSRIPSRFERMVREFGGQTFDEMLNRNDLKLRTVHLKDYLPRIGGQSARDLHRAT
ncbi:DUF3473 domain-containing protein [bacterium]|nr:DUF3473 domain-containing protein [bacterium]